MRALRAPQRLHQIGRDREHNGRGALAGDALQRREIAQLHRLRPGREDRAGLSELLRRLEFALGVDDLGAADAFGFRLASDRPHHGLVEVDVLELDDGDLDVPGVGLLVEDAPDIGVELFALLQHLVEIVLAEHGPQRGLRELAGRFREVLDLDDRLLGIDDAIINHRIDPHRDVVARDHVLWRDVEHTGAQVDADHLLDDRNDDHEAGALYPPEPAQQEHDGALILPQDAERIEQDDNGDNDGYQQAAPNRVVEHEKLLLWFDDERQTLSPHDADGVVDLQRTVGAGRPDLAEHAHTPVHVGPVHDLAARPDHLLGAGDGLALARRPRGAPYRDDHAGRRNRRAEDQPP